MSQRPPRLGIGLALVACLGLWVQGSAPVGAAPGDRGEPEIELERTVTLEVQLVIVERLPVRGTRAIARYRVQGGQYRGALFSLAYDYARPVRLRSWDMHDEAGFRRIGGARMDEPELGQWDRLFPLGSERPVDSLVLTLLQHDLNEDEKDRRWHFKKIVSIEPVRVGDRFDMPGRRSFSIEGNR